MAAVYFITGTDTGVGKTLSAAALLAAARGRGLSTAAVKPVAAGCEQTPDGWCNEDALLLRRYCSLSLTYQEVNPVALIPAIAPHIAARETGRKLWATPLADHCRSVMDRNADLTVIEGAGGWRVPLNESETFADIPRHLGVPVIMVVGMRLGCINHALLTAEAIERDGLPVAGWVANTLDMEMSRYGENVDTLKERLPYPLLGEIPRLTGADPDEAAKFLALPVG